MVVASTLYAARDVGLCLASLKPRTCLLPLMRRQLGGRPNLTPRCFARAIPSPQRERESVSRLTHSGKASGRTVMIRRPCAFVVSARLAQRAEARTAFRR